MDERRFEAELEKCNRIIERLQGNLGIRDGRIARLEVELEYMTNYASHLLKEVEELTRPAEEESGDGVDDDVVVIDDPEIIEEQME